MNNQDPIADMLTRIRNANRVGRRFVQIPKSKICTGIAQAAAAKLAVTQAVLALDPCLPYTIEVENA